MAKPCLDCSETLWPPIEWKMMSSRGGSVSSGTNMILISCPSLLRLGLPHPLEDDSQAIKGFWKTRGDGARGDFQKIFPMLATPPERLRKSSNATPYRLHNGIGPIQDDSIAFIGYVATANYFVGVEC